LAAKTAEQSDARLERLREARQERLAAETAEQSDARLERLTEARQEKLAAETAERYFIVKKTWYHLVDQAFHTSVLSCPWHILVQTSANMK